MASIEEATFVAGRTSVETAQPRRARPILWWATLGLLTNVLVLYIITAWIVSGDFKTTPTGPTEVPAYMTLWARLNEVGMSGATLLVLYLVVIRGRRRAGHLTFDGAIALAALGLFWQDPMYNWSQFAVSYNSVMINWGSWSSWIPGWMSQHGTLMPWPVLFAGGFYGSGIWLGILGANWVMRKAKARWPQTGAVGLVLVCLGTLCTVDLIIELFYIRWGLYSYGGAIKGMTLYHGHYYQFPLYETLLWGSCWTSMACLRYFRDDKGRSFVERGIDKVRTSTRKKSVLRLLAISGIMNLAFISIYNVPMQFFSLHSGEWPEDIQKRSYFTNGICAGDSGYACSSPALPINRTGRAVHIDTDGRRVVPPGVKLPTPVDQSSNSRPGG